ncbi:MAG: cobyric acid synthase [Verrucomicrobiota bacterium]
MKSISILGTSSNAGKSWITTALCAWLHSKGVRVAPFKAQNMANNAYATLEGGEIGVAQAIQAEACGLRPIAEMNLVLLKPSGPNISQIVRLGKAVAEVPATEHYRTIEDSWETVTNTLDWWRDKTDVLLIEGAGSPVELNLKDRDIANLRPINYVNGKWILAANIELGGVFSQVIGTWNLLSPEEQSRGLGFIVNRFRGDPSLFSDASSHFGKHTSLPYMGLLPLADHLRIEDEDSMSAAPISKAPDSPYIAFIRYPQISNTQDALPWAEDSGIHVHWTTSPSHLAHASAIVLPGSKNTIADLAWLREKDFEQVLKDKANQGVPIVGICGGYQMLGKTLFDPQTQLGAKGLNLLPIETEFASEKQVVRRKAVHESDNWETFEIHTGRTQILAKASPLLHIQDLNTEPKPEGIALKNIWGSYQHGLFESPSLRRRLITAARLETQVQVNKRNYRNQMARKYRAMAEFIEARLNLDPIKRELEL